MTYPKITIALGSLLLAACASTPPEYFGEHTPEYRGCPADMQLVCVRPGGREICECRF